MIYFLPCLYFNPCCYLLSLFILVIFFYLLFSKVHFISVLFVAMICLPVSLTTSRLSLCLAVVSYSPSLLFSLVIFFRFYFIFISSAFIWSWFCLSFYHSYASLFLSLYVVSLYVIFSFLTLTFPSPPHVHPASPPSLDSFLRCSPLHPPPLPLPSPLHLVQSSSRAYSTSRPIIIYQLLTNRLKTCTGGLCSGVCNGRRGRRKRRRRTTSKREY